jgi:hypothetical protein
MPDQDKSRYKYQPWFIKTWRQIRYKPEIPFRFAWYLAAWILRGCHTTYIDITTGEEVRPFDTRREQIGDLWNMATSYFDFQANNLIGLDECIAELRGEEQHDG